MKKVLYSFLFLFLCLGISSFAQEDKVDVLPEPIGGLEQIIKNVVYPQSAKEAGIEGKVFIKAIIDELGNVTETQVIKSVDKDCDKAAVDALKKTKFTPGMKDNKPVKTEVTIPIMFKLS
jgi:protein TonB